jgi:GNAT superfamily N-acetyltransferase
VKLKSKLLSINKTGDEMTLHNHDTLANLIRGWWHDPFEDMGYAAVLRQWGTYRSNGQVYVSDLPVTQIEPFLDDLRGYFQDYAEPILIHLDTEADKARIGPVLIDAGCAGPARESYLVHTINHSPPPTVNAIQLIPVSQHNLTLFSDTKLRAWSSSEDKPNDHALQAEIERRTRELQGWGRGMLAMIDDTPAGFIWWFDESSRVRWIRQLATRTPYRKRGVATRMLVDCVQSAYQAGMMAVIISVDPENNPALRLYSELGFSHSVYELATYTFANSAEESTNQNMGHNKLGINKTGAEQ